MEVALLVDDWLNAEEVNLEVVTIGQEHAILVEALVREVEVVVVVVAIICAEVCCHAEVWGEQLFALEFHLLALEEHSVAAVGHNVLNAVNICCKSEAIFGYNELCSLELTLTLETCTRSVNLHVTRECVADRHVGSIVRTIEGVSAWGDVAIALLIQQRLIVPIEVQSVVCSISLIVAARREADIREVDVHVVGAAISDDAEAIENQHLCLEGLKWLNALLVDEYVERCCAILYHDAV